MLLAIAAFSLVALAILAVAERCGWRGIGHLQRLALLLLLALPILAWLPKWHILPALAGTPLPASAGSEPAGGGTIWFAVWLAGALVQIGRVVGSRRLLGRWCGASCGLAAPADLALVAACGASVGLRRAVEVRLCPGLRSPAACGVFRPLVLLPAGWRHWDLETRRAVLLHEMSHHAARDPLWRMLALGATVVYWCHPLVWWLAARLRAQAEYACDSRVVSCGVRADHYAHILCDLAGHAPSPALAMAAPGSLEQRVRRLQGRRGAAAPVLLGAAALALATCALAVAVLRPGEPALPAAPVPGPAAVPYTPEEITIRQTANPFPADDSLLD
ncbi:MAG: M56 family metallopeptidase [Akkermansiaceae bacterium]|nr:M56 family metallopeptidase [Akkermansiaceae bacterium]